MACGFSLVVSSLIVPRCPVLSSCPSWSRHISSAWFPSRGGDNSRGHIFRAVFISSSHPPRLIIPSVPRLAVSIRGKQAGGRRHLIPFSWRYRGHLIVSSFAPSRLSCRRGGAKGVSFTSVPFPSVPFPHPAEASFPSHRSTGRACCDNGVAGQGVVVGSVPQSSRQASRQGGSSPVPPLMSAGGAFLTVPSTDTAPQGKQAGWRPRLVRPPRFRPASSPHRLIRLASLVGQRGGLIRLAASPRLSCRRTGRRFG